MRKSLGMALVAASLLASSAFAANITYTTSVGEDAIIRWQATRDGVTAAQKAQTIIASCFNTMKVIWVDNRKSETHQEMLDCLALGKSYSASLNATTGITATTCQ